MSTVYLINVGANMSHASVARSPKFPNGQFVYVSFPTSKADRTQVYPAHAHPFVRGVASRWTHADPDWDGLTYGDYCGNPRAGALKRVVPGDILLFWGLLWENDGRDWSGFTGDRDWFLLGAIRVAGLLRGGEHVRSLPKKIRDRALRNAHLDGRSTLPAGHYVFVGDVRRSGRFRYAVPLGTGRADGLAYRVFTAADGTPLKLNGTPSWKSSLRSCRPMWKLNDPKQRSLALLAAKAISRTNKFDLLKGII